MFFCEEKRVVFDQLEASIPETSALITQCLFVNYRPDYRGAETLPNT